MARVTEAVLKAGVGHLATSSDTGVDLTKNGQNGFLVDYNSVHSNAAYVKRNIIPVLLEAPRGFSDLPDSEVWIATLKNLVELHAQTIEGLTSTLTAEYVENAVGGGGEMQEDIANVTRERSVPVFGFPEKYGRVINKFFEGWILNLLMDPETKVPRVVNLADNVPADLLPDYVSMTMIFIEPDPTHARVNNAWLVTNMMPKTGGENIGRRDLTAPGESVLHSIEFTGLTQVGTTVDAVAQSILDTMSLSGVNPNNRAAFVEKLTADLEAVDNGFAELVERASTPAA